MKKKAARLLLIAVVLLACMLQPAVAAPSSKVTVTWATLAGFYTDWAKTLAKQFTDKTGIEVKIIEMDLPTMYEKEVLDIVGNTGTYDIITWNVSWKGEWANAGYIYPLDDYIKRDAAEVKVDDISQALLKVSGVWRGKTYGLPYYTFTPGLIYRADLFENKEEKAAFKAKFGYALDIPKTYDQMADIAKFFRRKAGEKLAGKVLTKDFYGIGLQAGRYNNIFDEVNTIAWTQGGDVIRDDGTPGVTDKAYLDAVKIYVNKLMPYAPPGCLSGGYDFVIGQLNSGLIAMTGPMYLDQWPNAVKTEKLIPGSEIACAGLPGGGKTWAGAFTMGIAKSTKHAEESWQFLKWITGPDAQRKFAEGGGSTARVSILKDKAFYSAHRDTMGHFPVLANVLEDSAKNWYTNYIHISQGAKIYEEAPAWLSAAASGEMTPEAAMAGFAKRITELCGNAPAKIMNEGFVKPAADSKPYVFDKSLQLKKSN
jgi:multiple sugar transport system substrate-binding protein